MKGWRKDNREYHREYQKKWRKENSEYYRKYVREYEKNRRANNLKYRLNSNIATAIGFALKGNKARHHWETLVGYTIQDLINRLSVNFQEGMSFKNYGEWEVDHIRPKSLFHYTKPEDQAFRDCWCLANLQPLWAIDNRKKGNKFLKV